MPKFAPATAWNVPAKDRHRERERERERAVTSETAKRRDDEEGSMRGESVTLDGRIF